MRAASWTPFPVSALPATRNRCAIPNFRPTLSLHMMRTASETLRTALAARDRQGDCR